MPLLAGSINFRPFRIGPDTVIPSMAVQHLGIYTDSDLSMQVHVQRSVAGCFAVLQPRQGQRPETDTQMTEQIVECCVDDVGL